MFFWKTQLSNFEEKKIALKLIEFLEQFMIDTFLITFTQYGKQDQ